MNSILRFLLTTLFFVLIANTLLVGEAIPKGRQGSDLKANYVEDEVIVKYKPGVPRATKDKIEKTAESRRVDDIGTFNVSVLKVPKGQVSAKVKELETKDEVLYAEPNFIRKFNAAPGDPLFNKQWGLHNTGQKIQGVFGTADADIDALQGWAKAKGSQNVTVAVVDTGIEWSHPDLLQNMWSNEQEIPDNGIDDDLNGYIDDDRGWDFFYNDNTTYDGLDDFHGTHVAGIIGAATNNSLGVSGINWAVKIMPVKFIGDGGFGTVADEIKALEYAADNGADIVNASYGSYEYSNAERDAIESLRSKGILFVAAAGNSASNNDAVPAYPASYGLSNIMSVGASNNKDQKAGFTNSGVSSVHIFAPGQNILSTYPSGTYEYLSGTSMAAPFVTGAAGLINSIYGKSYGRTKNLILQNKDNKLSFEKYSTSNGRLNTFDPLRNAKPSITHPSSGQGIDGGSLLSVKWNTNGTSHLRYKLWIEKKVSAPALEPFESAIPKGTSFKGFAPWSRTDTQKYKSKYSFGSGKIGNNKSSVFCIRRYVPKDSYITFSYKVSSEAITIYTSGDSLSFQMDGVTKLRASGIKGWQTKRFQVKQGWHTFKWIYAKDYSLSFGQDKAWIDNISFSVRPSRISSNKIGTTDKGATYYKWRVPSDLTSGQYKLCIQGYSSSKRTFASGIPITVR